MKSEHKLSYDRIYRFTFIERHNGSSEIGKKHKELNGALVCLSNINTVHRPISFVEVLRFPPGIHGLGVYQAHFEELEEIIEVPM